MDISEGAGHTSDRLLGALNSGDYARDFRAWIVAGMAVALACVGAAMALDDLLAADYLISSILSTLPCTMVVALWLLFVRRNLSAAAGTLVAGLFATIAIIMIISGGRASGAYVAVPVVVLTACVVADRRIAVATMVACFVLLLGGAWLTTRSWQFPVTIDSNKFVWGMVRTSIVACALNLIALLLYRQSFERTQSRLNTAHEREQQAAAVLSGLLNKHVSSSSLLFKLQEIGQLTGWWYDPATRRVHHTLEAQGTFFEFDLDAADLQEVAPGLSLTGLREQIQYALETGQPWDKEEQHTDADGTERWFRSSGETECDGEIVQRVVGVRQDITAIRAAQSRRAHGQKLEAMGTLAAGIAHEINTPIQYVSHNVSFVGESVASLRDFVNKMLVKISADAGGEFVQLRAALEKDMDAADLEFVLEELPAALSEAQGGLQRIAGIVSSMKSFAHPGANEKAMVDLHQAVQSTLLMCASRCNGIVQIDTAFADDPPLVLCAADLVNQVILNIVVNAADAIQEANENCLSDEGRIVVATAYNGDYAEIRITDNGPGMSQEIQDRIFDPFFTTKEVGKGSGQGLAISYDAIVNGHQGELLCESAPGQGTTFRIRLPLTDVVVST